MGTRWIPALAALLVLRLAQGAETGLEGVTAPPAHLRGFQSTRVGSRALSVDFAAMSNWGAKLVRLQVWPVLTARMQKKELWDAWPDLLSTVERETRAADACGLKVIIDMHEPPLVGIDSQTAACWKHPDLEGNLLRVWRDLATRLKPLGGAIYGYDLLNEPLDREQMPNAPREWRPLALRLVQAIRAIDGNVWIIYESGPGGMSWGLKDFEPLPDSRMIYSPHYYSPHPFTHQGITETVGTDLQEAMKKVNIEYPGLIDGATWNIEAHRGAMAPIRAFQMKYGVPILIGEFSVIRWAPGESGERWLHDVTSIFEEFNWSWCYHAFREFHGWSLEHDGKLWVRGMPNPQPSADETKRAVIIKTFLKRSLHAESTKE